jgi:hypothetical protein
MLEVTPPWMNILGHNWELQIYFGSSKIFFTALNHPAGAHSSSCSENLILGRKWPGHKIKHSLSFTTEVKNVFSYTFNLHMFSCMPRDFTYSFYLKVLIKF